MKAPRVEVITESEILAGLHEYVIDYDNRTATCRHCGTTAMQAMSDVRKARCKRKRTTSAQRKDEP